MDVLTLRGVLTLDKSEYDRGLETAEQGARSFGGRFSKAAKVGAAAAAALGVAAGYAGKKIVDGAKQVAEYGDKVDKMSQKIGISAEAYQKWDYVMQRAGGNVDQLKMGMKTLSQQAEKNSDAFQKLGISQEEVKNLNQEQLFERTIKGLSDMEAGTERTALASQLLGRAGADMGPLLNQGSKAIEEQMEIAEKYGMVMPDATVKASAAFEDSMTTMQMTAQGLKNRLLGEFLPAMTKVTDGMAKLFTGDMSGLDDVTNGIKDFIAKIGEMAPKVLDAGGKLMLGLVKGLLQKIPDMLSSGAKLFGSLLQGLQTSLANSSPVITQIVEGIAQFIVDNAPKLIETALVLITALAEGLIKAIPTLVEAVPQLIASLANAFLNYNWSSLGKSAVSKIASGVRKVGGTIASGAKGAVDKFKSVISTGFNSAKEKAISSMNALKKGVTDKINAAKDAVKKAVNKIKNFFPISVGKIFSGWIPKISLKANKSGDSASTSSTVRHERFAKAMNQPYLFTKPTIINQQEAGEAGDEVLYGKRSLMADITTAMQKGGGKTVNITNYITVDGAKDPEEYMQRFVRSMEQQMRTA